LLRFIEKRPRWFSAIIYPVAEASALTTLIARGRLRQVRNLLIEQASFSLVLVLGGAILLLILGTQILNWYWLVLLFAVSLGAGAYRGRNKILSGYRVAQSIDSQLGFHDALSTAYFFAERPDPGPALPELIERQRVDAETVARSTDLRHGIPFIAPKTFYINAALALAACTMFGVRYGVTRSLDLRASLIHMDFDGFFGSPRQVAEAKKRGRLPFEKDNPDGAQTEPWDSKTSDLEPQPDTPMETVEDTETTTPDSPDSSAQSQANGKDESPKGDDLLKSPDKKGDNSASNSDKPGEAKDSPDGEPQSGKQDNAQQNSDKGSSGENSSLADKMKDAISNLMAKLKSQPKSTEGKQGGSQSQPNQQSAQKQGQNQQNQKGNQGEQQSENNSNSQSQGDQQSQNGAQQSAQSQSEARNSDQTTKDGKSGIGKQDGDKTAREAEQQAAMGKISEIIGKRAANVSGEVMIEVSSGKQQLKTQYSQRDAKHAEAGGEINRDEVPLAYQQFVQQYFEEIRKEPPAKAKPDAKSKDSGN